MSSGLSWRLGLSAALLYLVAAVSFLGLEHSEYREVAFIPFMSPSPPSVLRLVSRDDDSVDVRISGYDSEGAAFESYATLLKGRRSLKLDVGTLEASLGDGEGAWSLLVEATGDVSVVAVIRDGEGREDLPVVQPVE